MIQRRLVPIAFVLLAFVAAACRSAPRPAEFGWPADVQGDATATADVAPDVPPVTCPTAGWLTVHLDDSGMARTVCAPDLPIWGVGPLSPNSLTSLGNGTVTDSFSHLQWQQTPLNEALAWQPAAQACDQLDLGGKQDWRLPTVSELQTILDFSRSAPAIALPLDATPGDVFWSAVRTPISTAQALGDAAWPVDFSFGLTAPEPLAHTHRVRCVRAEAASMDMPAERFSVDTASAVIDNLTHLEWDPATPGADHTGYQAIGYCRHMNKLGMGWHNADTRELASLLDRSRVYPALPQGMPMVGNMLVQSGNFPPDLDQHWEIDFSLGTIALADNSVAEALHCVRPACGNGICGKSETAQTCALDCQPMTQLPAGTVWMGCDPASDTACQKDDPAPHPAQVPEFAIDPYEVTVLQWQQCAQAGICQDYGLTQQPGGSWPFEVRQPMNLVPWQEARKFCQQWRGKGYDLPTEEQWERAARGTCEEAGVGADEPACAKAMRAYPWGNDAPDCTRALFNTGKAVESFGECAAAGGCGGGMAAAVGTSMVRAAGG